jgi:hypothetical protein
MTNILPRLPHVCPYAKMAALMAVEYQTEISPEAAAFAVELCEEGGNGLRVLNQFRTALGLPPQRPVKR